VDATQLRGAPILGGAGWHARVLLPAGATCHIEIEMRAVNPQLRAAKLCFPFPFTNAAFYAAAIRLSTAGRAMGAYAFAGKQLQRRGNVSARVRKDRSPQRKQRKHKHLLHALRAAIKAVNKFC